jgi:hypothetical protein
MLRMRHRPTLAIATSLLMLLVQVLPAHAVVCRCDGSGGGSCCAPEPERVAAPTEESGCCAVEPGATELPSLDPATGASLGDPCCEMSYEPGGLEAAAVPGEPGRERLDPGPSILGASSAPASSDIRVPVERRPDRSARRSQSPPLYLLKASFLI